MNLDRLQKQLMEDEGVKYEIYLDHLGLPTFGIGHLIKATDAEHGKPVGTKISKARVDECFRQDVSVAVSECLKLFDRKDFESWPDQVREVVVNMMFNLGRPRLSKFLKFQAALKSRNWRQAALEGRDSAWYRQVPNRAERLMRTLESI